MGQVSFSGGSPEAGQPVDSSEQQGVTPEPVPVVEQSGDTDPQDASEVDERGVPWKNVAREAQKKLEKSESWADRYKADAEQSQRSLDQMNQQFQTYIASQPQQPQVQPTVDLAAINPALVPGAQNLQPQPQAAPPTPATDPRVDQLLAQNYERDFAAEVQGVEEAYPEAASRGSDFNRELLYEIDQKNRQYGGKMPLGEVRQTADAIYGRMVRSGDINPSVQQNGVTQPVAPALPGVTQTPASPGMPGNIKLPDSVVAECRKAGIDPKEMVEAMLANPEKYKGGMWAIEEQGGKIGR